MHIICAFALYFKHTLLNTLPEQTGPSAVFNRYDRRLHRRRVSFHCLGVVLFVRCA